MATSLRQSPVSVVVRCSSIPSLCNGDGHQQDLTRQRRGSSTSGSCIHSDLCFLGFTSSQLHVNRQAWSVSKGYSRDTRRPNRVPRSSRSSMTRARYRSCTSAPVPAARGRCSRVMGVVDEQQYAEWEIPCGMTSRMDGSRVGRTMS